MKLWYEFHEKFIFILKLLPVDGAWAYVNNIYSESLTNMLQESVFHVNEPNLVLENVTEICFDMELF